MNEQTARNQYSDRACGRAIETMIEGALNYCLEFKGATDSSIGEDGVLGECMANILRNVRDLLDGPTGRLDCGATWARVQKIAADHGLLDDNGEL